MEATSAPALAKPHDAVVQDIRTPPVVQPHDAVLQDVRTPPIAKPQDTKATADSKPIKVGATVLHSPCPVDKMFKKNKKRERLN